MYDSNVFVLGSNGKLHCQEGEDELKSHNVTKIIPIFQDFYITTCHNTSHLLLCDVILVVMWRHGFLSVERSVHFSSGRPLTLSISRKKKILKIYKHSPLPKQNKLHLVSKTTNKILFTYVHDFSESLEIIYLPKRLVFHLKVRQIGESSDSVNNGPLAGRLVDQQTHDRSEDVVLVKLLALRIKSTCGEENAVVGPVL